MLTANNQRFTYVKHPHLGISYFAICGSEVQRDYLRAKLHKGIVANLKDTSSVLHDPRFMVEAESRGVPEGSGFCVYGPVT